MRQVLGILVSLAVIPAVAQTATQPVPTSDPQAIFLAQKSITALAGGVPVIDVTLNATVISIAGSDNETGTGTFQAKGTSESRVDLKLSDGTRSDIRNLSNGTPAGAWQKNSSTPNAYAQHNCWTDATWFFPALSSLTQAANSNFIFKYVGQEQHAGLNTLHVQVFQSASGFSIIQQLSTVDLYLDPVSFLPLATAFQVHPDTDMETNIAAEVRFTNYQTVNGIEVPFHFQRMLNGEVILDVNVTNAVFNSGLPDSVFSLQ